MIVKVIKDKCIGCGTCVAMCDQCFEIGPDGKAKVISSTLRSRATAEDGQKCEKCDLKEVATMCAVDAIEVSDE